MSCGKEVGAKQCLLKKHFECQAAEFGLNPASERVACDLISKGVGSDSKESVCNAGDPGSIPGSGRFPGEENGYPLQYSYLENPTDIGAWWVTVLGVTKGRT